LQSPWAELDREEEALNGNPFAGLGFSIPNSDWYGGKVEFRAKLKEVEPNCKKPQYKVALEQPELGHSTRFSRRFGSKSFLKIKIAKQILNRKSHHLVEFFTRPFILCGHVFRGFTSKDNNVFLVRTNEVFDGVRISTPPQSPCLSLVEFLEWHNPLRYNVNQVRCSDCFQNSCLHGISQTMAKWAARFALGLSNSVPLLPLEVHAIEKEPDISSSLSSYLG
jgi:hypothetical protein